MLRFGLSLLIYISIGRWLYSEVELYAPGLKPLVDNGLEYITIPRSDTWSRQRLAAITRRFGSVLEYLTHDEASRVNASQATQSDIHTSAQRSDLS